jgi:hypothetical protein
MREIQIMPITPVRSRKSAHTYRNFSNTFIPVVVAPPAKAQFFVQPMHCRAH